MPINFPEGLGNTVYEYDYFTGSQCLVYFEDVLVDDLVRIGWTINQRREPIFGYASQYWNAVADGIVIAGGSFWVAYKEAAYIPVILRHISARRDPNSEFFASPALTPQSGSEHDTGLIESAREWRGRGEDGERTGPRSGTVQRADIQRLMQAEARGADDEELQRILHQYSINLAAMSDRDFEDIAETFEDAIWYGGNSQRSGRRDAMSGNFLGGEVEDERFLAIRRADQFPPFDILITFGDINNASANHTVQRLTDCIITSTSFGGVEASGEPIYVQFDFMARNMM
jgi:hypothetical protein